MTTAVATLDTAFTALADPRRREVMERLSMHGQASATVLAAKLPISRQAVVQHLAVLEDNGLVRATKQGRERLFELRVERVTAVARWLENLAEQWDHRLAAIKRIAESLEDDGPPIARR